MSGATLTLIYRRDCLLCDEMLAALRAFGEQASLPPLEQLDVDSDAELQRRYGLQVPVLLLDGAMVCRFRFDGAALHKRLAGA
ncbi:MAG: glutaredoxin family protein [Steroidobacteraceae bacterium]